MLHFMKNAIHLDNDCARNTCNQICAKVHDFFFRLFFSSQLYRAVDRTVGGFGIEMKILLVMKHSMLFVIAKRAKSWNNNIKFRAAFFETNVSVTTERHWWHITAMSRA